MGSHSHWCFENHDSANTDALRGHSCPASAAETLSRETLEFAVRGCRGSDLGPRAQQAQALFYALVSLRDPLTLASPPLGFPEPSSSRAPIAHVTTLPPGHAPMCQALSIPDAADSSLHTCGRRRLPPGRRDRPAWTTRHLRPRRLEITGARAFAGSSGAPWLVEASPDLCLHRPVAAPLCACVHTSPLCKETSPRRCEPTLVTSF